MGRRISIHAPPRGATSRNVRVESPFDFNSRPSARGDEHPRAVHGMLIISIHAPPRGATCRFACCFLAFCISIHAPPRGATLRQEYTRISAVFQFTPLREGRLADVSQLQSERFISIHAPPRGATLHRRAGRHERRYFNSRPSARGDANFSRENIANLLFQFTPLREGRQLSRCESRTVC